MKSFYDEKVGRKTILPDLPHKFDEVSAKTQIGEAIRYSISLEGYQRVLRPNEVLYNYQDNARYVYLVKEGLLEQSNIGEDGKRLITSFVSPNQLCGELELILKIGRTNCVVAKQPSTVFMIPRTVFFSLFLSEQDNFEYLVTYLSYRIIFLQNRIEKLVLQPVAKTLLESLEELSVQLESENIMMNHQTIGDYLGITREYTSQILSDFSNRGLIKTSRNRITLCS